MQIFYTCFYLFFSCIWKYKLHVYRLQIIDKQMTDYLDHNIFETDEDYILKMLYYDKIDISEGIDTTKSNNS